MGANDTHSDELRPWRSAGFSAADAANWQANGFTLDQAESWRDVGISPSEARDWQHLVPTETDASGWDNRIGHSEVAQQWLEVGFKPDEFAAAGDAHLDLGLPDHEVTPYEVSCWNDAGIKWWEILFDGRPWEECDWPEKISRIQECRSAYDRAMGLAPSTATLGRDAGRSAAPPLPGFDTRNETSGTESGLTEEASRAKRQALLQQPGIAGPNGQLAKKSGVGATATAGAGAAGATAAGGATSGRLSLGDKRRQKAAKEKADKESDRSKGFLKAPSRKMKREINEQKNSDKAVDKLAHVAVTEGATHAANTFAPGSGVVVRPIAEKLAPTVVVAIKKQVKMPFKVAKWAIIGGVSVFMVMIIMLVIVMNGLISGGGDPQTQQKTNDTTNTIPTEYLNQYRATAEAYKLPWSMLAAVGWVASDHGRQNAYQIKSSLATTPGAAGTNGGAEGGLTDEMLSKIRACEASGTYTAVDASGQHRGGYQFLQTTWDSTASKWFPALKGIQPEKAAPADQDDMARGLYEDYRSTVVTGHGSVPNNPWQCISDPSLGDRQAVIDVHKVAEFKPTSNIPPSQRAVTSAPTTTAAPAGGPSGGPATYQQDPPPTAASSDSTTSTSTPAANSPLAPNAGAPIPKDAFSATIWPRVEPAISGEKASGPLLLDHGITGTPQTVTDSVNGLGGQMNDLLDREIRKRGLTREDVVTHPYTEKNSEVWLAVIKQLPVDQDTASKRAGLTTGGRSSSGSVNVGDVSQIVALGIPETAAKAYMNAVQKAAAEDPACTIPIAFLMGFGKVESGHGTFHGATMAPDGEVTPHIIGPVLDGSNGTAAIRDTDGGKWDNDPVWDRAVGPVQFIPSTWASAGRDGNNDGDKNPHNYFDETYAAAMLLCHAAASAGGINTDAGQRAAAFSYNHSQEYVSQVMGYKAQYEAGLNGGGTTPSTGGPTGGPEDSTTTTAPGTPAAATTPGPRPSKVIAVGDSLLAGTCVNTQFLQGFLTGIPVTCNARVGRPTSEGITELQGLASQIDSTTAVVIVLGHNGASSAYPQQLQQILTIAAPAQKIVLMTNTEWENNVKQFVNPAIRDAAKTNPKVVIADWYALYTADPSLLAADGVHSSNYQRLAKLLADAVLNGGSAAGPAPGQTGVMDFSQATYAVGAVYSGVADPSILKTGLGGATAGMQLATAGTYTLPLAKSWFDAHPEAFTSPHHDYPAADLGVPDGTDVFSATNGVVLTLSGGDCGNGVTITGDDGMQYVYCHGTEVIVKAGDKITVGQKIMVSGHSGHVCCPPGSSAAAHLHFQIDDPTHGGIHLCPHPYLKAWAQGLALVPDISHNNAAECAPGQAGVRSG